MIDELGRDLAGAGIHGARRERILAEFADHLACDPAAELGEPHELARQFADELGTSLARRAARLTFLALAIAAPLLFGPQLLLDTHPDIAAGRSLALTGISSLAMFVGAQIAFVAGTLALLRAWRVRHDVAVPAAEVGLLRRRALVGAFAGICAAAGVALYAVNFWGELPLRWSTIAVVCAVVAGGPLAFASFAVAGAGRPVVAIAGEAGGTASDFGRAAARVGPTRIALLVGLAAVSFAFASGWFVDGSLAEGALRGAVEAVAFVAGYLALGRALGLRDR